MTPEGRVQAKKIKELEREGYFVLKLMKTNENGIPDLLALKPNEPARFIEVKAANGVTSELQKYWINKLNKLGFRAEVFRGEK